MVKTIGNPLSFAAWVLGGAASHTGASLQQIGGDTPGALRLRTLTGGDLRYALRKGVEDFTAARADVLFLVALYPVIGLVLAGIGLNLNLLPLLFPLVAGFALLGPLAAVGLYEISRLREAGAPAHWGAALGVVGAPGFGAVVVLGLYLLGIFIAWMVAANWIYALTLGPAPPDTAAGFVAEVFTTPAGWAMIAIGLAVGFCFAALVLAISLVSFPLILDRHVGVPVAVATSVAVARKNPVIAAAWGLIVAAGLVLGSIPFLIGLVIVLPILGHATWHLYRRAVTADPA